MSTFTKTPNYIFKAMKEMGEAELRVTMALIRETFGYHRNTCKMTYTDLQEATGMTRGGVANGVKAVKKRGLFGQDGSEWAVYEIDYDSLPGRPEAVYDVDRSSLPSRPPTSGLKKDIKKDKESVATLTQHFQQKTGLFYSPALFDSEWEPVFEHWLEIYGDKTRDMIDRALDVAWGKNETGRRYTLKSPMSLQAIIANLDPAKQNGTISIGAR